MIGVAGTWPDRTDGADNVGNAAADRHRMQRFLHWLRENGARLSSLTLDSGEGERGVRSIGPIARDAMVAHIPRSLIITTDDVKRSPIGQLIVARGIDLSDFAWLAAFLIDNRREGSFWQPYVDFLPHEFPDHPFFFSEEELGWLNGSYTLRMLAEQKHWMPYECKLINSCLPPERQFSFRDFAIARCAVMSRQFSLVTDGVQSVGMVPFADMLNHSIRFNVRYGKEATNGFTFTAAEDVEAGMPVHDSYGAKGNALLLYLYGFCLDDNPYDETEIALQDLPASHPLRMHADQLGMVRKQDRIFSVTANYDTAEARCLLSFLRLACLADANSEVMKAAAAMGTGVDEVAFVDRQNEAAAMTVLAAMCRRRLECFDTSIEEDDLLSNAENLPRKRRYAAMAVRGEKRVLQYYLRLAETALAVLADPVAEIAKHAEPGRPFADYFAELGQLRAYRAHRAHRAHV